MLSSISKRCFLASTVAAASLFWPLLARAQEAYPSQNVRFVVAFPAGGPTDAVARILGQRLTEKWGQSVVIENRGGAGGNIATRQVAKAEPNGYTVLVTTSAYAVNPSLTANAGYAPETDYKTAIVVATTPNIIVASPEPQGVQPQGADRGSRRPRSSPTACRAQAPRRTCRPRRSSRCWPRSTFRMCRSPARRRFSMRCVGGHITLACLAMPPTIELIKSGQIKALAVISDKRVPSLPDVPTAMEQGFGDGEESTWIALFVPAGTPAAVLAKLNADINAVIAEKPILAASRSARHAAGRRLARRPARPMSAPRSRSGARWSAASG